MSQHNKFAEGYANFVMKFRWPIIVLLLIATVLSALQIKNLDIRNDPDTLLPPSNRYVATNAYAEQNFGMGNLMVFALKVKEGDIWQPWFINKIQEIHRKLEALPTSNPANFIDIAAQKIKYMGVDENGLIMKRLIPTEGISDDPAVAKEQLAFLREGVKNNPVMAPMLVSMWDKDGNRCAYEDYDKDHCIAKAAYVIADYSDEVKSIYLPWVKEVRAMMDEYGEDDRIELLVAGEPYFLAWMLQDLVNKWWLFVISIAIVIAVLWMEFRNWRGAIFPLIGVFMTIAMTLGLMGFSAFKLTTMMVLTPMLLLAIGIGHSVQVTRRFLFEHAKGGDCNVAARDAIAATIIPATLSIVTDMVGFATLASVDISFYKAYAYFGMFGMLTLLLTTTTLIPLLMSKFPPSQELCLHSDGHGWEKGVGNFVTKVITGPLKWIPIAAIVAVVVISANYANLYNMNNIPEDQVKLEQEGDIMPGVEKGINYARAAFKGSSQTWKDLVELNKVMPGVISVSIPLRGKEPNATPCTTQYFPNEIFDMKGAEKTAACAKAKKELACWDAEACGAQGVFNEVELHTDVEKFENWLRAHPYVGYTGSYTQYIRLVNYLLVTEPGQQPKIRDLAVPNREYLTSIDPDDDRSPKEIVQMYNGLLQAMTSDGDMESFVKTKGDNEWNEGVVLGFINTMDPRETHQVTMDIQNYIEEHKNDPGFSKVNFGLRNANTSGDTNEMSVDGAGYVKPGIGGFLGATEATREVAMDNWLISPLQTALAIFLIAALMFRSFLVSGILVFTLLITLMAQYGLGGYFTSVENWSGNLAFHLLVTLSIAMGLGVDYGIYMISRLREEMAATGNNWLQALRNTQNTTGSAVIVSIIVLLGSFIPLVGTDLANTWGLGVFIGEALVIDMVTALVLIPLLVYWFKPKYVFKPND